MKTPLELAAVLVPTDFSPSARDSFDEAVRLVGGEDPSIIVLHVIDPVFVEFAVRHGLAHRDELIHKMRKQAEQELEDYKSRDGKMTVQKVISEGLPFLEIIRKADEFAVDAIIMGKVGWRGKLENVLFGSTAEKVLRGSRRPVLVLPHEPLA